MIDINLLSTSSRRFGRALSPILSVTAIGVLLAGCGQSAAPMDTDDVMMSSSSAPEAMMEASSAEAMMSGRQAAMMQMYKNGTFSADGVYRSPAGGESVHVSLTLQDNVVTDATFSGDATHAKSKEMQAAFLAGFKEHVVGKSLDEVSVGVVNGSSLTGGGFMNAVTKIKAEAKA